METETKRRWLIVVASVLLTLGLGFIFMTLMELLVELQDFHQRRGFLWSDGPTAWVFMAFLLSVLLLYWLPQKTGMWLRLSRSLLLTALVAYCVLMLVLVPEISSMRNKEAMIVISCLLTFFPGLLLLEHAKAT